MVQTTYRNMDPSPLKIPPFSFSAFFPGFFPGFFPSSGASPLLMDDARDLWPCWPYSLPSSSTAKYSPHDNVNIKRKAKFDRQVTE